MATPLTDKINALTTAANETTGASDTTLGDAVATLIAGYGGGSGTDYLAQGLMGLLTSYSSEEVTVINTAMFRASVNLASLWIPNCTSISVAYALFQTQVRQLALPSITSLGVQSLASAGLYAIDLGENFTTLSNQALASNSGLVTVVIRASTVPTLDIRAFNSTPFASGGSGGTIYVPSDLISSYQSADNWSTLDGYGTVTWAAIEGSNYESYYVDGTAIS